MSRYFILIIILIFEAITPFCIHTRATQNGHTSYPEEVPDTGFKTVNQEYIDYIKYFNLSDIKITNDESESITNVNIKGADYEIENNYPRLPIIYLRFIVPMNSSNFKVELTSPLDSILKSIDYPLPVMNSLNNIYNSDIDSACNNNHNVVELCGDCFLYNAIHLAVVKIRPIRYHSSEKLLSIYPEFRIRLSYSLLSEGQSNMAEYENLANNLQYVETLVENPYDIAKFYKISNYNDMPRINIEYTGIENTISNKDFYYIITDRSILHSFDKLVLWKEGKGYNVIVKSMDDILSDDRYKIDNINIVDAANSLRAYLIDECYEKSKTSKVFCLIAGNEKTLTPYRYYNNWYDLNNQTGDYEIDYIPTDNYFSDLSSSHPLKSGSNKIYGYKYSQPNLASNYKPNIYVGRLLCHEQNEIQNYIDKLIAYESGFSKEGRSYLDKSLFTVQFTCEDDWNKYGDRLKFTSDNEIVIDSLISDINSECSPTGSEIIRKMGDAGYISLLGHGNPGKIGVSGKPNNFDYTDIEYERFWEFISPLDSYGYEECRSENKQKNGLDNLNNIGKPGIIYSISCTTTPFDKFGIFSNNKYNMGAGYTVAGRYGGVAFLGNTREGHMFRYSTRLQALFTDCIKSNPCVGIAEANSKVLYLTEDARGEWESLTHNLIGDPEFNIWSGEPSDLNPTITLTDESYTFSGRNLAGSKIYYESYGTTKFIKKLLSSTFNIPCPQSSNYINKGLHYISIWKNGFSPFIQVSASNGIMNTGDIQYIVKNCLLGYNVDGSLSEDKFIVKSKLKIDALENARISESLMICEGGSVSVKCADAVDVDGVWIGDGGNLEIKGRSVVLKAGTTVCKGGRLIINK